MKHLIILALLCVALCADTNDNRIALLSTTNTNVVELGSMPYVFDTTTSDWDAMARYFPATWNCSGTQFLTINLVTNVITQWLPIERAEGPRNATVKQLGILITNQVLTVIAYEKTNEVVLKMLGREEWPSQRRTVIIPNQQRAR